MAAHLDSIEAKASPPLPLPLILNFDFSICLLRRLLPALSVGSFKKILFPTSNQERIFFKAQVDLRNTRVFFSLPGYLKRIVRVNVRK
jgi:hypothetical protein